VGLSGRLEFYTSLPNGFDG